LHGSFCDQPLQIVMSTMERLLRLPAHGGKLWAIANEDRRATFQFTLPPGGVKA